MATEVNIFDMTYLAYGDLRSNQFFLVEFVAGTERTIQRCSSTVAKVCGIIQNNPNSGQEASVRHLGLSKMEACSGARGSFFGPDAAGRGTPKSPIANSGQYIIAQAAGESATASSRISVIVAPVPTHVT